MHGAYLIDPSVPPQPAWREADGAKGAAREDEWAMLHRPVFRSSRRARGKHVRQLAISFFLGGTYVVLVCGRGKCEGGAGCGAWPWRETVVRAQGSCLSHASCTAGGCR